MLLNSSALLHQGACAVIIPGQAFNLYILLYKVDT